MAGPGKKRVPLTKVTVSLPSGLFEDVGAIVNSERRWISAVDFIRWAVANEVEHWKRDHPLGAPRRAG
jgi:hypothetical protein